MTKEGAAERIETRQGILCWIALFTLSVAQPLYDILGRHPEFFVAHRAGPAEIWLGTLGLSVVAPVAAAGFGASMARWAPQMWRLVFPVGLAGLTTLLVLAGVKGVERLPGGLLISLAIGSGALFSWLALRFAVVRWALAWMSLATIIAPLSFALKPGIQKLLFPPRAPDVPELSQISPPAPPRDEVVVMVVFDELPTTSLMDPAGDVNGIRFPGFARLATQSHWFRNATTVSDQTIFALAAILTGSYPKKGSLLTFEDYPRSMLSLLSHSYEIEAIESVGNMCSRDICDSEDQEERLDRLSRMGGDLQVIYQHLVTPNDLATRLPPLGTGWKDFGAGSAGGSKELRSVQLILDRAAKSLADLKPGRFLFVHVPLPHIPWKYLPSGQEYGPIGAPKAPEGMRAIQWSSDPWAGIKWLTLQGYQRHLLQLGFADRFLLDLLDTLERRDLFDSTVLVVTADHGVSFRENDYPRRLTPENRSDILGVPLFFKKTGQTEGRVHDRNAETIDILPTLAAVLEQPLPWEVSGQDLFSDEPERSRRLFVDPKRDLALQFPVELPKTRETLERLDSLMGDDWDSVYALGSRPDLWRRPVSERIGSAESSLRVELDQRWFLDAVDLQADFVPSRMTGTVSGVSDATPMTREVELVLGVNGMVCATTWGLPQATGKNLKFSALVPLDCLKPGKNEVRVFEVIDDAGGEPTLAALRGQPSKIFRLGATPSGSDVLLDASGAAFDVDARAAAGKYWVDPTGVLEGWALDPHAQKPVDEVLVFLDGSFVSSTPTEIETPSLVEDFGTESLARCAFRIMVPEHRTAELRGPGQERVRVFAVVGSRASELVQDQ